MGSVEPVFLHEPSYDLAAHCEVFARLREGCRSQPQAPARGPLALCPGPHLCSVAPREPQDCALLLRGPAKAATRESHGATGPTEAVTLSARSTPTIALKSTTGRPIASASSSPTSSSASSSKA